jgi:LETM1 and EF-hand domain-containing protein 1
VCRYWTGLKLLKAEFKFAWKIVRRLLDGATLTRREKQQLMRSAGDLLKLVPFIVIVIGRHLLPTLPVTTTTTSF